jgi:replicative DNA helicase
MFVNGSEQEIELKKLKDSGRQQPASPEVERSVLGAMLIDKNAVPKAIEILKPEYFYEKNNKTVFEAALALYEASEPIDTVSIYEELKRRGKVEQIGGAAFISKLSQDISSAANIDYHSRVILEKWILRELIATSVEIASSAFSGREDVFDLLDEAESKIFGISQEGVKESFKSMDKAVREALELIEAIHSNKKSVNAVPTGFFELDNLLGGFQKSDLIILAARPSMGKTALALSIARNAAIEHEKPIALFSLEMSDIQLAMRLISAEARINAHSIRTGKFRAEDGAKISRTVHKISKAPIYIDDTPSLSILEMRAKCRRLKAEKNISLVIVDYLQLMTVTSKIESREREISLISRSLKALAKELDIPVVALSQLNRAVESRSDKKPMLSDLRESGSIEQDADVVMFLYRPEVYGITQYTNDNMSTEGIAEVLVSKQRNGPVGDVRLKFLKDYARFENLDLRYNEINTESLPEHTEEEDFPI